MDDFRLRVFVSAARNLSFTKCSKELYISQPAVSKHISELENEYHLPLFLRRGSSLALTPAGKTLLRLAENILDDYNKLHYEMNSLNNTISGTLRVGASTTISQYILPPILAQFIALFPQVKLSVLNVNSESVETELFNNTIDLGLIENDSKKIGLQYSSFIKDELVAVASTKGKYADVEEINLKQLQQIPLVLRESGSGTLEVIEKSLSKHNISMSSLNVLIQLGSTEAIKSFVQNSDAMCLLSVTSICRELAANRLKIIDIKNFSITREFNFVWRQSEQNKLAENFMRFASSHL